MAVQIHEKIALMPLSKIKPYEKNTRDHSTDQVKKISESILKFGFNQPLVLDEDGTILVGHGRFAAAKLLALDAVPCLVVKNLSEENKKAYRILDNKIQNDSTWNIGFLETELADLQSTGFEFETFGLDELCALFGDPVEELDRESEYKGMPEYNQEDKTSEHKIVVHFASLDAVPEFAAAVAQDNITKETKSIWFPAQEKQVVKNKAYK